MTHKTVVSLLLLLASTMIYAQNPKWFKKAQKAQISIITYDEGGNILSSGYGFYINESGTAIADYSLFENAHAAKVVNADGKEYDVETIEGASSLYDVVRFQVNTNKKSPFLVTSQSAAKEKDNIYIMPYPTKDKKVCLYDTIKQVQTFNEKYAYYTIDTELSNQYLNSPILTPEGEVIGLIQRNGGKGPVSYAIDVNYVTDLTINALSSRNNDLNNIHIRKTLPKEFGEASTFLFMIYGQCDSTDYIAYLNDFINAYPDSSEVYIRRFEFYLLHGNYEGAESDIQKALSINENEAATHYTFGRLLYELNLSDEYTQYKDWDLNKALEEVQKAYAIQPLPLYLQQEAKTLYALKSYEQAHEKFLSLTQTNLRSAEVYLNAAECLKKYSSDTLALLTLQDSAIACLEKPYKYRDAQAFIQRANTLIQLNRHRQAVADLYEYEKIAQEDQPAIFYYRRYLSELECRMYQQALDDIDKCVRIEPSQPLYHLQRSTLLYKVGETTEAIKSAQKTVELAPDYAEAYRILAIYQLENKQREVGLKNLSKAAELGDAIAKEILKEEQE